jgi:hypothetical protein
LDKKVENQLCAFQINPDLRYLKYHVEANVSCCNRSQFNMPIIPFKRLKNAKQLIHRIIGDLKTHGYKVTFYHTKFT